MSDVKETQIEEVTSEQGNKSKKEKRVDYQNTEVKVKTEQEPVRDSNTFRIYNPSSNMLEIDLGRDKSVRLQPYGEAEIPLEYLEHPAVEGVKNLIKIY